MLRRQAAASRRARTPARVRKRQIATLPTPMRPAARRLPYWRTGRVWAARRTTAVPATPIPAAVMMARREAPTAQGPSQVSKALAQAPRRMEVVPAVRRIREDRAPAAHRYRLAPKALAITTDLLPR